MGTQDKLLGTTVIFLGPYIVGPIHVLGSVLGPKRLGPIQCTGNFWHQMGPNSVGPIHVLENCFGSHIST